MEMLKYLRLAVCVVCIAAFASGCGGGGGMATPEEPPAVVEPPPDPGPTDEERIEAAQDTISGIIADAQTQERAARSDASAVEGHAGAMEEQETRAGSLGDAARDALTDILGASAAANAATTPAQAETAVAEARAALSDLRGAESSLASLRSRVEAVADARRQRELDEAARTGGSSLIQRLSDNKKVSGAVLGDLALASLLVGAASGTTGTATYPYHEGTPSTLYPRPRDTDRGVLGVMVTVGESGSTEVLSSNSQTGKISGTGRLSKGFDLKGDNGRFATVYTDMTVAKRVEQKTGNAAIDDAEEDTTVGDADDGINQRYQYIADTDYLLAGIWLDDTTDGSPVLRAFAFGSQPLVDTDDFCTATDVTNTSMLNRACGNADGKRFDRITGFVDENESEDATYRGGVNGAYFAGGKTSHFKANVSLMANFVRGSIEDVTGSKISGEITNISAGGNSITGSIDLKEQPLGNDLSDAFAGKAAGVIAGHAYTGDWKGQFFGMRATKLSPITTGTVAGMDRITTTTYTPDKPNSVAGSFYVNRETVGDGDAAFIGAFGAHR